MQIQKERKRKETTYSIHKQIRKINQKEKAKNNKADRFTTGEETDTKRTVKKN